MSLNMEIDDMPKYTKEDVLRMCEAEDVEFIRLQFTDIFGNLKNIAVTYSQLERALDDDCFFEAASVAGFTGDDMELYLHPDPDTFVILPWRPQTGKVARLLCDIYTADGRPYGECSRTILKNVVRQVEEEGYTFKVGSECEFFLFELNEKGRPTNHTKERAGYMDPGPMDSGENARRDMVLTLEDMGIHVEASYHEVAPGQHEIGFHWAEPLCQSDRLTTFKFAVRTIAQRHGMHATFMPKPEAGVPGSGMHLNYGLYDRSGINVFADSSDPYGLSELGYYFIGGLLKHSDGMCVITNPIINSYKRLVPGYSAPVYKTWSTKNKSALIRVAKRRDESTKIELRSPDPSANPYLALAVSIAAGMDGIKNKIMPPAIEERTLHKLSEEELEPLTSLPTTLGEAIAAFEKDTLIQNVLGEKYNRRYLRAKRAEWNEYLPQVSQWELERYLYRI